MRHIRPARLEDYEAICSLFAEGDDFHQQALPHLIRPAVPARTAEFFQNYIGNETACLWVAESGPDLLGLIKFHVVVTPERPLMKAVNEWAQAHGLSEIELNVHEFNQGPLEFYEKLGYATVSRRMAKRVE